MRIQSLWNLCNMLHISFWAICWVQWICAYNVKFVYVQSSFSMVYLYEVVDGGWSFFPHHLVGSKSPAWTKYVSKMTSRSLGGHIRLLSKTRNETKGRGEKGGGGQKILDFICSYHQLSIFQIFFGLKVWNIWMTMFATWRCWLPKTLSLWFGRECTLP